MAATKIAYIQARWHTDITDNCKTAFVDEIQAQGYREHDVEFFSVPGSLEIPLMAKKLANTGRYLAVCCSGLVVDGGIYRHEFVAQAVLQGIVNVSVETGFPESVCSVRGVMNSCAARVRTMRTFAPSLTRPRTSSALL